MARFHAKKVVLHLAQHSEKAMAYNTSNGKQDRVRTGVERGVNGAERERAFHARTVYVKFL